MERDEYLVRIEGSELAVVAQLSNPISINAT